MKKESPNTNQPLYVISVAARLTKTHPRTLRIYEEFGLLNPARTQGNIRLYSPGDINLIRRIRYFTRVKNVNLAGVKIILEIEDKYGIVISEKDF